MSSFLQSLCSGSTLLMDGAIGTELLRAGLRPEEPGVWWNLAHPETVLSIHRAYRAAGAEVLLTNTFQANPLALRRHGLAGRLEEITAAGVQIARAAAGPEGIVLAAVGPILDPGSMQDFTDLELLRPTLAGLVQADALLLETCSSARVFDVAHYCRQELPDWKGIPILVSLAYRRDQSGALTTYSGQVPEVFAKLAAKHGIAALGVNCGRDVGVTEAAEVIRRYRTETVLPLFARPNAGAAPNLRTPEEMAVQLPRLLEAGAGMVGGCCGTTPEHIAAFRQVLGGRHQVRSHEH